MFGTEVLLIQMELVLLLEQFMLMAESFISLQALTVQFLAYIQVTVKVESLDGLKVLKGMPYLDLLMSHMVYH